MRRMVVIATAICAVCLVIPFKGGGTSFGMAQTAQGLTPQEAVDAARRNAQKPGSSFTVLRAIVANADTRRIGNQALEQSQVHKMKLFKDGILVDLLRAGGFLLAETEPRTNNVIALHLVSSGPTGDPNDAISWSDGVVKLADAEELVKDTTELTEKFYSTPPSEALSLESRFSGGRFPDCGGPPFEECSLFAIPRFLLKLGADPTELREVAALYGGLAIWQFRYAVSMPTFAANPSVASQASEGPIDEFLRKNHLDPDFRLELDDIQSKKQLRERIDLVRRMGQFLEEALRNKTDPALVKANVSVAAIALGVSTDTYGRQVLYASSTGSLFVIYWQRLPKGGFAVKLISETDADTGE